jgi:hypothetical protein
MLIILLFVDSQHFVDNSDQKNVLIIQIFILFVMIFMIMNLKKFGHVIL